MVNTGEMDPFCDIFMNYLKGNDIMNVLMVGQNIVTLIVDKYLKCINIIILRV